jgi:hypothetical protein
MKEPVPFLPRLRCPKCRNTKPPSLAIATQVYWIYPEWRVKGAEVVIAAASGEVNFSGAPASPTTSCVAAWFAAPSRLCPRASA